MRAPTCRADGNVCPVRVTVLGAGYMGSAMAKVARMRGHDVRLWGTWLDDPLLDPCARGEAHPRLKLTLDEIALFRAADLARALDGAELVVHAVNSDGVVPVVSRAREHLPDVPILSVTKGFLEGKSGRMERIDVVASETAGRALRFVHAGGPAKAIEIARRVLTLMQFAGADAAACADAFGGGHMCIGVTDDIAGAEVCSALKNAYATGLGLWDGHVGKDAHNARAACFTQAIVEMGRLVLASGGRAETVHGAAGVGDLHVTAAAGRNRAFGERVGGGRPAAEVAAEMLAAGELTEGYPAIKSAWRFAKERGVANLPLLSAIHAVIWENAEVGRTLAALRLR
jgi:glycerol-3-phosphate dehydrogenase (NAD(P)+)